MAGLMAGLAPGKNAAVGDPRDPIRSNLAIGLAGGLGTGLVGGLMAGLAGGLGGGLAGGLVVGLVFGLMVGACVVLSETSCRYLVAVSIAASIRLLPYDSRDS